MIDKYDSFDINCDQYPRSVASKRNINVGDSVAKLESIKAYCIKHKEYMWAAHIWSIITGEDFRDIAREKE